jgi:hypothetical protein
MEINFDVLSSALENADIMNEATELDTFEPVMDFAPEAFDVKDDYDGFLALR